MGEVIDASKLVQGERPNAAVDNVLTINGAQYMVRGITGLQLAYVQANVKDRSRLADAEYSPHLADIATQIEFCRCGLVSIDGVTVQKEPVNVWATEIQIGSMAAVGALDWHVITELFTRIFRLSGLAPEDEQRADFTSPSPALNGSNVPGTEADGAIAAES